MAFSCSNVSGNVSQTKWSPCLYNSTVPYSLYATSAGFARHGNTQERFADYTYGMSGLPNSGVSSQYWYPQNHILQGHEYVPTVCMAPGLQQQQQVFRSGTTSMTAFQMATDFAALMDATDPVKCRKQVHPFYWRKRGNSVPAEGMTRTKDKYRVVYTEKQRAGLEKAFRENKFITIKQKNELSKELDLSARQIKIWFQNRRAKERRQRRKAETGEDHVTAEKEADESRESTDCDDVSNILDEKLGSEDHISSPNYLTEESTARSQCLYQQSGNNNTNSTSPLFYQSKFSASPSEWHQRGASLVKCDVSPFTSNPDWSLVYRS